MTFENLDTQIDFVKFLINRGSIIFPEDIVEIIDSRKKILEDILSVLEQKREEL